MPVPKKNIIQTISDNAEKYTHKFAFEFLSDTKVFQASYRDLDAQMWKIAAYLAEKHPKGDRILILLPPGPQYIFTFYGCLAAGIIAVTAYPPGRTHHQNRLEHIIEDTKAAAIITDQNYLEFVKDLSSVCYEIDKILAEQNPAQPFSRLNEIAFLQYTSGSTGNPKGVMITHENIIAQLEYDGQKLNLSDIDKLCSWLPPFHDMGLVGGILCPLQYGMQIYLQSPVQFIRNPLGWLNIISKNKVTISPAPNFAYSLCTNLATENDIQQLDLSSWRCALNGAEPVSAITLQKFAEKFAAAGFKYSSLYPTYGMAETTLMISGGQTGNEPHAIWVDREAFENAEIIEVDKTSSLGKKPIELVSSGTISPPYDFAIVNSVTLEKCPINKKGEIWVRGPSVAIGYWQNEEATNKTFECFLKNGEGPYLNTGDLGFVDSQGRLYVTGRIKEMLIYQGRNIYAHDIEYSVLNSHPILSGNSAAAFTSSVQDESHIVVIETKLVENINPADVLKAVLFALKHNLDFVPQLIILTKRGALPRTTSGKIQRHLARDKFNQGLIPVIAKWPEENLELESAAESSSITSNKGDYFNLFIAILKKVLTKYKKIEIKETDSIASLGITSVEVAKIITLFERESGHSINPTVFWEVATFGELHQKLKELSSGKETVNEDKVSAQPTQTTSREKDIAVIGMSCRLPGEIDTIDKFWEQLIQKFDAIAEPSPKRLALLGNKVKSQLK